MIVYAVKENDTYAGFSLTDNLERDMLDYLGTPLSLVELGIASEEIARNLVDFFTNAKSGPVSRDGFQLTDAEYTLTAAGQALWDSIP